MLIDVYRCKLFTVGALVRLFSRCNKAINISAFSVVQLIDHKHRPGGTHCFQGWTLLENKSITYRASTNYHTFRLLLSSQPLAPLFEKTWRVFLRSFRGFLFHRPLQHINGTIEMSCAVPLFMLFEMTFKSPIFTRG